MALKRPQSNIRQIARTVSSSCVLKSSLSLLRHCFCLMVWFFSPKASGIFSPRDETHIPSAEGEVQTTGPPGRSLTGTFAKTTDLVCLKSQCHFKLKKKKSNGSVLDLKEAKERSQPSEIHGNTVPNPGSKYGIAVKGISLVFKAKSMACGILVP